jgi:hypothetical protein
MQQRGRHSGRDQLIALIESAASASASQMLVEEQLSDAALLCQPEALTFVPPKDWQSSPDASKLTLHVTEHRVNVADPLQRCAMPFAEYTITVWSGSVSWCVRRRFSDFATLNLDVATAGIPPLKDAPFGGLLSVHPFFQRRHADALEAWLHAVCRSSPEALRTLSLATFLEIDRFHPACAPRLLREARWGRRPPSPTEVTVLNYNMAPARPRRFNAHRRRILCLHGWGEDMDVFRAQTSQLRVALPHFDFFFIQAPSTSEALSGLPLSELAAPVYSKWCEADAADTVSDISSSITSVPSTPAQRGSMPSIGADRADPASVPSKSKGCPAAAAERDALDGVERCADVVREMVLANGPFDAVLGVAQGGVLVALLSALQRGFAPPKPFGLPELPCLWKVRKTRVGHTMVGRLRPAHRVPFLARCPRAAQPQGGASLLSSSLRPLHHRLRCSSPAGLLRPSGSRRSSTRGSPCRLFT